MGLSASQVGVRQEVYLPVHRTLQYTGSLYAKYASGSRALEVSIRQHNRPENVLTRAAIDTDGTDWRRYDFQLEIPRGKIAPFQAADFAIEVTGQGHEVACCPLRWKLYIRIPLARRHRSARQTSEYAQHRLGHAGVQHLWNGRISAFLPANWRGAANCSQSRKRNTGRSSRMGAIR